MIKETEALFLEALRAALHNETVDWEKEIPVREWVQLFQTAQMHKVQPMIFEAVFSSPAAQKLEPAVLEPFRRQTVEQVMCQTMKTEEFLRLFGYLRESGITPLVFKGIICRSLYPRPDHRLSGDEDILIPAGQFSACHEALCSCGMQLLNPEQDIFYAYEVSYVKKQSPLYLEVHKSLFEPDSDACGEFNDYFAGVFDRAVQENVQGAVLLTMGRTDHFFYLLCHALKHFIHCGIGIRQVCDIVLFADAYGQEIDWGRIEKQCREIHADLFAAALFQIGRNYLGLDRSCSVLPREWKNGKADERAMLADLLRGGIYGSSSMSRQHSSSITRNAVANQKTGKKAGRPLLRTLFPAAEAMQGRYPYLKERKWLLPAAWAERVLKYRKEVSQSRNSGNSAAEAVKIGRERIELMKQYGIIK